MNLTAFEYAHIVNYLKLPEEALMLDIVVKDVPVQGNSDC